MNTGAQ